MEIISTLISVLTLVFTISSKLVINISFNKYKKIEQINKEINEQWMSLESAELLHKYVKLLLKYEKNTNGRRKTKKLIREKATTKRKADSIVEGFGEREINKCKKAVYLLLACILCCLCINKFSKLNIQTGIIIFLCVICWLILILQILFQYRIYKGYYGTNYEEVRKLIQYIMKNEDKNDNNKGKKIFVETKESTPVAEGQLEY